MQAYNAKLERKMYYFFQSFIPVNPKDKHVKFLGVRQKHLSLQILVHKAQEIRLFSECWKTTDIILEEKKEVKSRIYLRAFTVEEQGEKHRVTEIEKRWDLSGITPSKILGEQESSLRNGLGPFTFNLIPSSDTAAHI